MNTSLDTDAAHELLFAEFDKLDALCQRRFRADENLAHEALLHLLDHFGADDFAVVRRWPGDGLFGCWLAAVARRAITDFERRRLGHIRAPQWVQGNADVAWPRAYALLIVERQGRNEAVSQLMVDDPGMSRARADTVVANVLARCRQRPRSSDFNSTLDDTNLEVLAESATNQDISDVEVDVETVLELLLSGRGAEAAAGASADVQHAAAIANTVLARLGSTDVQQLRRRFVDRHSIPASVRGAGGQGDPYRQMQRTLARVRTALDIVMGNVTTGEVVPMPAPRRRAAANVVECVGGTVACSQRRLAA